MNREPNISEIEKLIRHFKDTGRESELLDVLDKNNVHGPKPDYAIDPETHEVNPEGYVVEKIEEKEGTVNRIRRLIAYIIWAYREKWYVRYGTYYVLLFFLILGVLNLPIILNSFNQKTVTDKPGPQIVTYQELQQSKMADSAPLNPGEVIPSTNMLVIPKISVNSPLLFIDTRDEKVIDANLPNGVVHYTGTANPGEVGNNFIVGHSSNFWWIQGNYNYVFLNLDKLVAGDQAVIYYNGKKFVYQVTGSKVVAPTDTSVLAATDTPTLSLMTCTPAGTNWRRLVITFNQIAPVYNKPVLVTKKVVVQPSNLPSTDTNSAGGIANTVWGWITKIFNS